MNEGTGERLRAMRIGDLGNYPAIIPILARWHFDHWGSLTGTNSFDAYVALLTKAAQSRAVPSVLVAMDGAELAGSANLRACDLPVRPNLTPWLGQLFVAPRYRRQGVGAALVRAVLDRAHQCDYPRVYLFTSGTLPEYYRRLGWRALERVEYHGRERTIMDFELGAESGAHCVS